MRNALPFILLIQFFCVNPHPITARDNQLDPKKNAIFEFRDEKQRAWTTSKCYNDQFINDVFIRERHFVNVCL
jgi:hypothetical protein